MNEEEIIEIFGKYLSKVTNIEYKEDLLTLTFDNSQDWDNKAFGSKTIDYMWENGYRVCFWNFMDSISMITFRKVEKNND